MAITLGKIKELEKLVKQLNPIAKGEVEVIDVELVKLLT